MTATDSPTITCPVCDAPNAAHSLFCAECGTPLKDATAGDTAAIAPSTEPNGQSTAVIAVADRWQPPTPAPEDPSSPYPDEPLSPSPLGTEPLYAALTSPGVPQSRRGFWLGIVAALLMLAILLLWIWAAVLDQGTRDSFGDFFGFLN